MTTDDSNSIDDIVRVMRELASADRSLDLIVLREGDYAPRLAEGWSELRAIEREGRLLYAA